MSVAARVTAVLVPNIPTDALPLTLDQAKAHLRIDTTYEDALVGDWIAAATRKVENDTGLALITQTWDFTIDDFDPALLYFDIPKAPVQSVSSVTYYDTLAALQTWAPTSYRLIGRRMVRPLTGLWPIGAPGYGQVTIRAVVGFGDASAVPPDLLHAVRLVVGWLYANREPAKFEQDAYDAWIWPYRRELVGA